MMFAMNYLEGSDVAAVRKKHVARKKSDMHDWKPAEEWFAAEEKSSEIWIVTYWNIEQKIEDSLLDLVVHIIEIAFHVRLVDVPMIYLISMMDE